MSKHANRVSRRQFLTAAAGVGGFTIVPRWVLGGTGHQAPSATVYVAGVGAGGMAGHDVRSCRDAGGKIVALCDVDDERAADLYGEFPQAEKYHDFRVMLDDEKGIDAVIVGTPDHTHAVATMAAIMRGKHVYCEKPLAHSIGEVRKVTAAAHEHKVATQLGNQGHSFEHIRLFCEWIWDGAIGQVREVHVMCDSSYSNVDSLWRLKEQHDIPAGLDWDLWLGPAKYRPYHPMYVPRWWRSWSAFGTGTIGDWVCHIVDPVFWALNLKYPVSVEAQVANYDPKKHAETFPRASAIRYEFAATDERAEVTLTYYDGGRRPERPAELEEGRNLPDKGALVVGEKGKIIYGSHGADGARIIPEAAMEAYERPEKTLPRSPGHHAEWLAACKSGKPAGSNFSYGGPLTEIALLGNVAIRMAGEKLKWDGEAMRFTNCDEANRYVSDACRDGWTL